MLGDEEAAAGGSAASGCGRGRCSAGARVRAISSGGGAGGNDGADAVDDDDDGDVLEVVGVVQTVVVVGVVVELLVIRSTTHIFLLR